jgi:hypothetical protein
MTRCAIMWISRGRFAREAIYRMRLLLPIFSRGDSENPSISHESQRAIPQFGGPDRDMTIHPTCRTGDFAMSNESIRKSSGRRMWPDLAVRIPKLERPNVLQARKYRLISIEMDDWALKTPKIEFPRDGEGNWTFTMGTRANNGLVLKSRRLSAFQG